VSRDVVHFVLDGLHHECGSVCLAFENDIVIGKIVRLKNIYSSFIQGEIESNMAATVLT